MLTLLVTLSLLLPAPPEEPDVPALHRGGAHFFNAVGTSETTVEAAATPVELHLTEAITYTITVRHVRNPHKVIQPDFYKLREFGVSFATYPADITKRIEGDTVVFQWKMRPRTDEERTIPGLEFEYYVPETGQVYKKFVDPIAIMVHPKKETPRVELAEREWFRERVTELSSGDPPAFWKVLFVSGFLMMIPLVWGLRRMRNDPQGVRDARLRRNRIVKATLDGLKDKADADTVATLLRSYQQARHSCPALDDVLRTADQVRFGNVMASDLPAKARDAVMGNERIAVVPPKGRRNFRWRDLLMLIPVLVLTLAPLNALCWIGFEPPMHRSPPEQFVNDSRDLYSNGNAASALAMNRTGLRNYPTNETLRTDRQRMRQTLGMPDDTAWFHHRPLYWWLLIGVTVCMTLPTLVCVVGPRFDGSRLGWLLDWPPVIAIGVFATIHTAAMLDLKREIDTPYAIVSTPAVLRTGTGDSYDAVRPEPLPTGTEAVVLHTRGDWLQVRLSDGTTGWLPRSQVLVSSQ